MRVWAKQADECGDTAGPRGSSRALRALHPMLHPMLHPLSALAALAVRTLGGGATARWWHRTTRDLLAPYRPELHYMRGPGPKWREKHGPDD